MLRRSCPRREPSRPPRRPAREQCDRLRRAADRARDARRAPSPRQHARSGQGLRHPRFRRELPRTWRHSSRRPASACLTSVGDRWSNDSTRRIPNQPDHPDADRTGLRLAQDRRRPPAHSVSGQTQDTVRRVPRGRRVQLAPSLSAAELRLVSLHEGSPAPMTLRPVPKREPLVPPVDGQGQGQGQGHG